VTYLRNFAENNSRHLRWRPNLSELYFTVEHRAGFKIRPVDALSRHMGALIDEDIQDMNNVLREQAKDAFCVEQKPGIYSSKREFFLDDEDVVYKSQTGFRHQLVVPKTLIHRIIKVKHDSVYIAHPSVKRNYDLFFTQLLLAWNA